jgi:hypothetical protein
MVNEIKELESVKAYKCLRIEGSHNIENKNEKEKFTEEYVTRLR